MANKNIADINKQIEELQKQREELIAKEKANVIESIRQQIADYSITAEDLGLSSAKVSKGKTKAHGTAAVKYRKDGNEWSGRGRTPAWAQEIISKEGKEAFETKYKV